MGRRRLAQGFAADPLGRGLLSTALVHRRAGAAAVSFSRGSRHLFRRGQDAVARLVHPLRDVGDDGASLHHVQCRRRQGRPRGLRRAFHQVDVLAVARRDAGAACTREAAALAVRTAIHRRLRHHVRRSARPCGALRDRAGRAVAQHAGSSIRLRRGLRHGILSQPRPEPVSGAEVRRLWRRGRDHAGARLRDRAVVRHRAAQARPARPGVRQEADAAAATVAVTPPSSRHPSTNSRR